MNITDQTKICMTIGYPVGHSLSPQMHNAGFKASGLDGKYIFVRCNVKPADLENCVKGVKAMDIHFVSVTIPHKIEIMKFLDEIDETAKEIGAVNTVINDNGILKGSNTDWLGAVTPLEKITSLENKIVALLGAGGAARGIAYGVTKRGAKLTIYNRTLEKAQELADQFDGEAYSLEQLEQIKDADIIINTTSVGMHPNTDESPLQKEYISNKHIVLDAVYNPYETKLLKDAGEQGATIIHGTEMLVYQGAAQFTMYTGKEAPVDAMRNALELSLRGTK